MNHPDYTQYSSDELKQALNSIDKETFPERAKLIEEEIISRNNNPHVIKKKVEEQPKKEIKTKSIEYDISSISNWIIRTILVLQIGGGFLGIFLTLQMLLQYDLSVQNLIVYIIAALFFIFGIYSAMLLSERKSKGLDYSILYNLIQIPILSSPILSFEVHVGAYFGIIAQLTGFSFRPSLGSAYNFSILSPSDNFVIGINILALVIFLILRKSKSKLINA